MTIINKIGDIMYEDEFIFYFKKGNPKLRGKRINGVINCMHIGFFDKTIHPTQKPEKLMRLLIKKCSDEENIVLDAFVGGGEHLW